jgi:hypothetical protein
MEILAFLNHLADGDHAVERTKKQAGNGAPASHSLIREISEIRGAFPA